MVEATIEDLAITSRPSRESGRTGFRVCIKHCCELSEMAVENRFQGLWDKKEPSSVLTLRGEKITKNIPLNILFFGD
jgi:hypothetical protein